MLCKYKDALGIPGEGVHSIRLFNIAVVDVILTFLVSFLVWLIIRRGFWIILLSFFLLGIVLHRIFCVRTTIDKLIFKSKP
jgi:type IV secretory pathway TrbL component